MYQGTPRNPHSTARVLNMNNCTFEGIRNSDSGMGGSVKKPILTVALPKVLPGFSISSPSSFSVPLQAHLLDPAFQLTSIFGR